MAVQGASDLDDIWSGEGLPAERESVMAQKIRPRDVTVEHVKSTDLMFVDVQQPKQGARITTVDVGEMLGFPGQVFARVDYENEILYGLTIHNASSFKRKLLWRYRMASAKHALSFMMAAIRTGLRIEEQRPGHVQNALRV
jgi:hypothetical protein